MRLFFKYANACLAIMSFKLSLSRLVNSLGNDTVDTTCVCFIDFEVFTKLLTQ